MWLRRIFILFFISAILTVSAPAQKTNVKSDSTHLYKNIETYSKRPSFTRRSKYEAVYGGTNRGCGGSHAAGPHSGLLVIQLVLERVRWFHNRRLDQRQVLQAVVHPGRGR